MFGPVILWAQIAWYFYRAAEQSRYICNNYHSTPKNIEAFCIHSQPVPAQEIQPVSLFQLSNGFGRYQALKLNQFKSDSVGDKKSMQLIRNKYSGFETLIFFIDVYLAFDCCR